MKQKVWLITGVSKGLGREIAKQVVESGNIVIGTVRTVEDKEAFESDFDAKAHIIDLSKTDRVGLLIEVIIQRYGRIDVLVNNAGYGAFGMIEEFEESEIIRQFNVNFIAVWKLCKTVLPHMREKGEGVIVQISSSLGVLAGAGNGIYASSKFALEGMSEALKKEVEPFGIKVLLIEPGALRTDFLGESIAYARKEISQYEKRITSIRTDTKAFNGKQLGNPVKATKLIIEAVDSNASSFRLPLTSGAIEAINAKIIDLKNCIDLSENAASTVDY